MKTSCATDYLAALRLDQRARAAKNDRRPTAIFACNDMMAIGVMRAADVMGINVPSDLALVGIDNIELAAYTHPPLTTVAQDKKRSAKSPSACWLRRSAIKK